MSKLTEFEDTDDLHNPSNKTARDLSAREQDGDVTPAYERENRGDSQVSVDDNTDPDRNIKDIRDGEENDTTPQGLYNPNRQQGSGKPAAVGLGKIFKSGKKGPVLALMALGLGLPTLFTILLSPALLLQQMSEIISGEFNDQLAAMDIRSQLLLRKKFNSKLTSNCGSIVTIRCKYQSIRENSGLAKRLNAAGVGIEGDRSLIPGRVKPTAFTFNGRSIPADQLVAEAAKDRDLLSALRKGYDPLYAAYSDSNAGKLRNERLKLKRSSNVESSSDQDKMNEDLKATAAGTSEIPFDGKPLTKTDRTDADGKPIYEDSTGVEYSEDNATRINNAISEGSSRAGLEKAATKASVKAGLRSALTVTAFGAGAVDSMCTAWNLIRIAGYAAKYYQQLQVIRYSYEFMKIAHKQKYGDLTPEEMAFFGNKLTSVNAENKAALDSAGYRFAAYGDTFRPGDFNTAGGEDEVSEKLLIQNETSRYVNGQLLNRNVFSKFVDFLSKDESSTIENADKTCEFTKSWKGQALVFGLAAVGLGVAIFTGGISATPGVVINAAASVTIAITLAMLQPKLVDMAKGEVIKGTENGNETGNAIFSGAGGYNSQTAQARGLRPATQETFTAYRDTTEQIAAKYAEEDSDSKNPLNASNPDTFLGSITAKLLPLTSKQQTVGQAGTSIASFIGTSFASLGSSQTSYAAEGDKYSKCDDPDFNQPGKFNLAADPFCNVRYALPEASTDPEAVLTQMLKGGPNGAYISETDSTPQGDYKDYVERCIERKTAIGDTFTSYLDGESEGNADDGRQCVIGQGGENEARNTMFAQFYVDTSIDEGMENDFADSALPVDATEGANFKAATFNILHEPDDFEGCDWKCRLGRSVSTLKENNIDIAGIQEARPEQQKLFKTTEYGGDVYDMYPSTVTDGRAPNQNPDSVVIWDKSKFSLVKGDQRAIKYTGGERKVNIVKLKYIEGGAEGPEVYVLNTHDPIDAQAGDGGGPANRKDNNELYHSLIKNELTDAPVVFAGDFNSKFTVEASANKPAGGLKENLAYCILTRDDLLVHVSDAQEGKTGCESTQDVLGRNDVDHIFISPGITASGYGAAERRKNGGDHEMVYTDLEIAGSASSTGAGSTFVIGTYNQKRSLSKSDHDNAAKNIVDKAMDVVGTQETSNPKYSRYRAYLGQKNYGVYPLTAGANQTCSNAQAIFYSKSKFKLLKGEYFEIPRYPDPAVDCGGGEKTTASHNEDGLPSVWTHIPIVWLQDVTTGQAVIVMNAHNVANVQAANGTQPAKSRFRSNQIFVQQVERLKAENPGIPIFFTGDFNEGTNVRSDRNITWQGDRNNLLFCMFATNGLMKSAAGPAMKCDPSYDIGTVDYIYVTPEVQVNWTREIESGGDSSGPPSYTDHPVRYAQVTVPGSGGSTNPAVGGWVWPINPGESKPGPCYGGSSVHAGMVINSDKNSTVYAMSAGKVVRVIKGVTGSSPATGNHIMVQTSDGVFYGYQHLQNGSITVAVGDTVSAGQSIAKTGATGNVSLGSSLTHLHITMAKTNTTGSYGNLSTTFDPLQNLSGVKPGGYNCT